MTMLCCNVILDEVLIVSRVESRSYFCFGVSTKCGLLGAALDLFCEF